MNNGMKLVKMGKKAINANPLTVGLVKWLQSHNCNRVYLALASGLPPLTIEEK